MAGTPISEVVKFEQRVLPYVPPMTNPMRLLEQEKERKSRSQALEAEVEELQQVLEEKGKDLKDSVLEERLDQLAPALARDLRQLLKTSEEDRDSGQKSLAKEYAQLLIVTSNELKERDAVYRRQAEKVGREIAWLQHEQEAEPRYSGALGPRSPLPHLSAPAGRLFEPGPAGRAGGAFGADRRQNPFPGGAPLAGIPRRPEDVWPWPSGWWTATIP